MEYIDFALQSKLALSRWIRKQVIAHYALCMIEGLFNLLEMSLERWVTMLTTPLPFSLPKLLELCISDFEAARVVPLMATVAVDGRV